MEAVPAIVLFSWIPIVLVIFAVFPPRRAVILAFLIGYLFLPETRFPVSVLPDFSKLTVTAYALVLAILIFDARRLASFRLSLLDVPVIIFLLVDIPTSISNGLGAYDGFTRSLAHSIQIGIPWFVGRLYFRDLEGLRELAIAIFISGLVYMPLCLLEIRISPQLHNLFYGEHAHEFQQTIRFGGYRPTVFLGHGLHVGIWMGWATLCGIWLFWTRSLNSLFGVPMLALIVPLGVTAVLCKSTGALALLALGCMILAWMKFGNPAWSPVPIYAIAIMVCLYLAIRTTGLWHGEELVSLAQSVFGADRAHSLNVRLTSEQAMTEHASRRILLGWGAWDRNRPAGVHVITDSNWIIVLGVNGIVGLAAFVAMILGPPVMLARKVNPRLWMHPAVTVAPFFAVLGVLTMLDLLLNSGYPAVLRAAFGGLAAFPLIQGNAAGSWEAMVARMRAAAEAQGQAPPETAAQRAARRRKAAKRGRKPAGHASFDWPRNERDPQ